MRFAPEQRLRRARDFASVRTHGISRECGAFILQIVIGPLPQAAPVDSTDAAGVGFPIPQIPPPVPPAPLRRCGFIATKRLGGAVERNRAKRLLRETFRLSQEILPPDCTLVLLARPPVLRTSLQTLCRRFRGAIHPLVESAKKGAAGDSNGCTS